MAKQPYIQSPLNYIGGKYKNTSTNITTIPQSNTNIQSTCFAEDVM